MPPDSFICIDSIEKPVKMNSGAGLKKTEKLFIPKHQKELWQEIRPELYKQIEFNFEK